jgi:hypothetical protein
MIALIDLEDDIRTEDAPQESLFEGVESNDVPDTYSAEYDNLVGEGWISNSALSLCMTCGEAFHRKYILRIPEARGIRSTAGSGAHKGREVNLKQKIESEVDMPVDLIQDAARDYVHKVFDENPILPDSEFEGKSKQDLRGITSDFAVEIAMVDALEFQPVIQPKLVEHRMAIKFPGMSRTLVGMCDNVEINDDIRDLKSSTRKWGQQKADEATGMTTYGIMRYAETGKLPENYYVDNVVASGKTPAKHNALVTSRSKAQLEQHLFRFIQWGKVIDSGLFGPCDPTHWKCSKSYCGYFMGCPYGNERSRK